MEVKLIKSDIAFYKHQLKQFRTNYKKFQDKGWDTETIRSIGQALNDKIHKRREHLKRIMDGRDEEYMAD